MSTSRDALTIHREEDDDKGRYWIALDGYEAEMTYSRAGSDLVIIDHTGVPDELGGRGLGKALVQRGIEDARAEGRRIIPLCPYAKALIEKTPEWQDVLRKD